MAKLQRTIVKTDQAPRPIALYAQAIRVKAGELVYLAGQVALDVDGKLVGKDDPAAQTRQVFSNLGKILESVGASFGNVVEFTTYVVGRQSIEGFMRARTELFPRLFPEGDYPPNTLLVVTGLVREEYLVEIKATAALP